MSDNTPQSSGAPDPWAPPENSGNRVPLDKPGTGTPAGPPANPVHDQPTVTSMPAAGPVPSAPAPTDAVPQASGEYGYPTAGAPGAPGEYGYPSAGTPGEYGYPPAYPGAPGGGPSPYDAGYPGYPGYPGPTGWTGQTAPQNGMGVAAMVLGILSICLFCMYGVLSIILGALGLIFGILGRKKAERGEANNGGMALAGIITGSIGLAIGLTIIGLIIWAVATHQ